VRNTLDSIIFAVVSEPAGRKLTRGLDNMMLKKRAPQSQMRDLITRRSRIPTKCPLSLVEAVRA
jgi:hypothetical protein